MHVPGAQVRRLYEPPDDLSDVMSLAVIPSGEVVVEVRQTVGKQESSQLFLFDPNIGTLGEQLTKDGDNGLPAW